jgi:carbonic anhydrase
MLFAMTLLLSPQEEHGTPATKEAVPTEVVKKAAPKPAKPSKLHPAKATEEVKSEEPEAAPKPVPKAEPKPVLRRKPSATQEAATARLAEAEARATRLVADNARLQQEMAKATGEDVAPIATPAAALAELQTGNSRFVSGHRVRTLLALQDPDLRATLAKGQAPFAVIITCSDSRLADNLIFDQELGRLFTIREAGNSPDLQGLASVEYAAEHLGSKLVVVMGHTACGAIKAVAEAHGKPLPGHLWAFQAAMAGLLETTPEDPNELTADYYKRLAEHNAQRQAQALLDRSEMLRELAAKGKLKIVAACYDLASGEVRFLDAPKAEAEHE